MEKKLKIQANGRSDEFQTPKEAHGFDLNPFLNSKNFLFQVFCNKIDIRLGT